MEDLVLLEKVGNIAILKINRPRSYNALTRETIDLVDSKLDELKKDKEIRVLIITGDEHFAAGADITDMIERTPEEAKAYVFTETFKKLEDMEIPTIAAICGYALGGGFELALACDLRIASEEAQIALPEINLGIVPGAGGTVRLPRLIGEARAKEMVFLGEKLSAVEAYQYGIFNKVVAKKELMKVTLELAEKLVKKAPIALKVAKESINCGSRENRDKAFEKEVEAWAGLFATHDQKEGMRAFIEKRKPQYRGQ